MRHYLFILLFLLFFYSFPAYASVVLNEVAIQPNQVVELYNTASESADISSWYIDDAGGSTYFTVPAQTILAPNSCLIFSSDFNFNKASADVVRLFNNTSLPTSSSAKLVEQYSYTKAPDSNYSFNKNIDGGTEWQTSSSSLGLSNTSLTSCIFIPTSTPFPTPTNSPTPSPPVEVLHESGTPTPTPSQVDYQNIFISEVYPYPLSGEHEWIEIYNGNDEQVNLDHWYLDDSENAGSTPKSFSLIIEPYSYGTNDILSSLFNNAGDEVRLLNSNKLEKDSMEYGKIVQGKSIGRISFSEDSYCQQEATKNTANSLCVSTEITLNTSPQTTRSAASPTKTIIPTTKKQINQALQLKNTPSDSVNSTHIQKKSEILGVQTSKTTSSPTSPTPYLSFVSVSYSLLTIVSVFIKMKYA